MNWFKIVGFLSFLFFSKAQTMKTNKKGYPIYAQKKLSRLQQIGPDPLDIIYVKKNGNFLIGLKAFEKQNLKKDKQIPDATK